MRAVSQRERPKCDPSCSLLLAATRPDGRVEKLTSSIVDLNIKRVGVLRVGCDDVGGSTDFVLYGGIASGGSLHVVKLVLPTIGKSALVRVMLRRWVGVLVVWGSMSRWQLLVRELLLLRLLSW